MTNLKQFDLNNVMQELEAISKDDSLPESFRQWASDGISFAREHDVTIDIFPSCIFGYMAADTKMPTKVRNLVEGILVQSMNDGSGEAANNLGRLYYDGTIGEQSYQKALNYYEFGAKFGNEDALENLGYIYYYGTAGKVDYQKAFNYFSKGAFVCRINSLYKIADMYKNGYYVEKDEYQAFAIYNKCLDLLHSNNEKENEKNLNQFGADIYVRLADCKAFGYGCKPNYSEGLYWANKAEYEFRMKALNGDKYAKEGIVWAMNLIEYCRQQINEQINFDNPKYC